MELNNIKLETTWNDAAARLNENFAKLKQAIALGSLGHPVMLDTEMSDESENVVQNKVIKKYVDDLEANIKENPSEFVPLKTINGKSVYGEGNIVIEGGNGGTGLKYSEERTVYLTKTNIVVDETLEITEEEREYNIETFNKMWDDHRVFITWSGMYFNPIQASKGDIYGDATFQVVAEIHGVLTSCSIKVDTNGEAALELKEIKTGGSETPSDMNSDFSNDF
jgi:hypothetical protein